jgi:uncharacterized protein (TIGR00255 family)
VALKTGSTAEHSSIARDLRSAAGARNPQGRSIETAMMKSMTAFAREEVNCEWGAASWELRSVNLRFLDVSTRLPDDFRSLEVTLRERIAEKLTRGKVDCVLRFSQGGVKTSQFELNTELGSRVIDAARQLASLLGEPHERLRIVDLLRWPGVIEVVPPDLESVARDLLAAFDRALDSLLGMRLREGTKIAGLIDQRCTEVVRLTAKVREALPQIQSAMRERLLTKLEEAKSNLDNERLEQELVLFAHKMDVSEELDRLDAHVEEVRRALQEDKPSGRRLDFLMQEMNREANTLGSKSVDMLMTAASVDLKVAIEQMREQIQNLE